MPAPPPRPRSPASCVWTHSGAPAPPSGGPILKTRKRSHKGRLRRTVGLPTGQRGIRQGCALQPRVWGHQHACEALVLAVMGGGSQGGLQGCRNRQSVSHPQAQHGESWTSSMDFCSLREGEVVPIHRSLSGAPVGDRCCSPTSGRRPPVRLPRRLRATGSQVMLEAWGWGGRHPSQVLTPLSLQSAPEAPPPPKRAPTTALTLRSKSMTSELEELGKSRPSGLPSPALLPAPGTQWDQPLCSLRPCMAFARLLAPVPETQEWRRVPVCGRLPRWHLRGNPAGFGGGY